MGVGSVSFADPCEYTNQNDDWLGDSVFVCLWSVGGSLAREAEFAQILAAMGFNETEIADFVEFWDEKLEDGVDYIMYPQDTATVNLAMPIIVNPMPESVERIGFVFEVDEGQHVEEPEDIVLERDDEYALVEWGGMIFE